MPPINLPPMQDFGVRLVFRLTLEFLVEKKVTGRRDNQTFEDPQHLLEDVIRLLDSLGLSAIAPETTQDHYASHQGLWQVSRATKAETAPQDSWLNPKSSQYTGVSLRTPFFSPTSGWAEAVFGACEAIAAERTVGINTNTTLKVEMKLENGEFDLDGLQNMASAPYLFNKGQAIATRSPMFELAMSPDDWQFPFYAFRMLDVLNTLTKDDLIQKMRILPTRDSATELTGAFVFSTLQANEPDERTLGFAQHSGALNMTRIYHWVSTCLGIVDACLTSSPARMDDLLERLGDPIIRSATSSHSEVGSSLTVAELLLELKLEETARYFEGLGRNPQVPELAKLASRFAVDLEGIEKDAETSPQYTFGVEMEFMVPAGEKVLDPHPQDPRWFIDAKDWKFDRLGDDASTIDGSPVLFVDIVAQEDCSQFLRVKVARLLANNGFFASISDNQDKVYLHKLALDSGFTIHPQFNIIFQSWQVQHDISLVEMADPVDGYSKGFAAMEVASPMGRANAAGFRRFAEGLTLMRNSFRTVITKEAGLHVHVSPHNKQFDLLQLKRIVTVIWFAEPITQLFIAPHRRGPNGKYCLPISTSSDAATGNGSCHLVEHTEDPEEQDRLEEDLRKHVPLGCIPSSLVQKSMGLIWSTMSLGDLTALTCNGATRVIEGTIEFRAAQGCMDQMYIIHWVRLCVALVRKGQHGQPGDICEWVSRLVEKVEHPLVKLPFMLESLGLSKDLEFWQSQVERFSVVDLSLSNEHVQAVSEEEAKGFEHMLEMSDLIE
ncbi:hypothetical protein BN1708_003152 [Verticillium longisporum]|uniref:Uncharacterized protein n=1 Tax=Verticillium longisporum TaxID=100787 RepID=A0A0G4L9U2_VERLO|nr:hypothetical protein BN1708_003152 [Verticillium longisporum]